MIVPAKDSQDLTICVTFQKGSHSISIQRLRAKQTCRENRVVRHNELGPLVCINLLFEPRHGFSNQILINITRTVEYVGEEEMEPIQLLVEVWSALNNRVLCMSEFVITKCLNEGFWGKSAIKVK